MWPLLLRNKARHMSVNSASERRSSLEEERRKENLWLVFCFSFALKFFRKTQIFHSHNDSKVILLKWSLKLHSCAMVYSKIPFSQRLSEIMPSAISKLNFVFHEHQVERVWLHEANGKRNGNLENFRNFLLLCTLLFVFASSKYTFQHSI